jgi:hypothetical protein
LRGTEYRFPVSCYSVDKDLTASGYDKRGSEIVWDGINETKNVVHSSTAGWMIGEGREDSTRFGSDEVMYGYTLEIRKMDYETGTNNTEVFVPNTYTVKIGDTSSDNTTIDKGVLNFRWWNLHTLTPRFGANVKTSSDPHQPHKEWQWELVLDGDRRTAFYAQDVTGATEYACVDDGDNTEIDYFVVTLSVVTGAGVSQTRTVTLTGAVVGPQTYDPAENRCVYSGYADKIVYADA